MTDEGFVVLKGSGALAVSLLQLVWRLEEQGVDLQLTPDGRLDVGPADLLRPGDLAAIEAHEAEIIALCRYVDRINRRPPP